MSLTGTLGIEAAFAPNAAARVRFWQPKTVPLDRLLIGCAPDEAVRRVGSLFALCGHAHALASASAIEAIQQLSPSPSVARARLFLVAAEAIREHVFRVCMDWPTFLGLAPQAAALMPVTEEFAKLRALAGQDVFRPGAAMALPLAALEEVAASLAEAAALAVFGAANSPLANVAMISRWAESPASVAAEMLAKTRGGDLPSHEMSEEQTIFGRWQADARLTGNEAHQRLLARLLEIDALCRSLSGMADIEGSCRLSVECGEAGHASSAIDVARGRLTHDLAIEGGRITAYAIAAPTGRNFEPGGAAEQAIARIRTDDRAAFERLARLAVLEIDPCVAYDLRFTHA